VDGHLEKRLKRFRRPAGLARVEMVTDMMKKGANGENKLMADHS
jgi:hypothetical protein